jgi:hypothetical protein
MSLMHALAVPSIGAEIGVWLVCLNFSLSHARICANSHTHTHIT